MQQDTSKTQEPNPKATSTAEQTHRGAFGEYGSDSNQGFIERGFSEKILLVGVTVANSSFSEVINSLEELASLVKTAGANPVDKILIKRDVPHPGTYIGKGKVAEIYEICERLDIDTVVFDNDLTASQQVNLEKVIKRSAIDRTTVILDIFAQNASSQEGRVQVELAQLKHRAAKLRRSNVTYSQQAGGIGSRGPGETRLETDRRVILRRTSQLEKELKAISKRRNNQAKRRLISNILNVALVGYTNVGKSSLLNRLTGAEVLSKNSLFSTLDATTRKLELSGGQTCLITDTVGFIRKLPHTLIEAFASTLSGVTEADLLIHVIDTTASDVYSQITEVNAVLQKIGADEIPQLLVFNKVDVADNAEIDALKLEYPSAIFISAEAGYGIDELLTEIPIQLVNGGVEEALFIPYEKGAVMADIHRSVQVLEREPKDDGVLYTVKLPRSDSGRFIEYRKS